MVSDIKKLLADHRAANTPLPMLEEHDVNRRLTAGWDTNNPLLPVSTGALARGQGSQRDSTYQSWTGVGETRGAAIKSAHILVKAGSIRTHWSAVRSMWY